MENKVQEIKTKINKAIELAVWSFNMSGENDYRALARINGMIEVLQIITGKNYYYNEKGLFEK